MKKFEASKLVSVDGKQEMKS